LVGHFSLHGASELRSHVDWTLNPGFGPRSRKPDHAGAGKLFGTWFGLRNHDSASQSTNCDIEHIPAEGRALDSDDNQRQEPVMSRTSSPQQPHLHPVYSDDAPARELSEQQADREDRRWQLEWARRNVED
jgi:hypothetical protein